MIKGVLGFLFGKSPDIFDADGNVLHKFPQDKWQAWNRRFQAKDYDWRHHKGSEKIPSTAPSVNKHQPKV